MYEKTVKLEDNEVAVKVNTETGVITNLPNRPNNIPSGSHVFEEKGRFIKRYRHSWMYLRTVLSPLELEAVNALTDLAIRNTNSLEPLSDKTTIPELMEMLGASKNKVNPILKKLFYYGVYAKFEVCDMTKSYTKYWILNPFLAFNGKLIKSDIVPLFSGTRIAIEYFRRSQSEKN